jgi:hypothetical protein
MSKSKGITLDGQVISIIDSDGHVREQDVELYEYLEEPYRGNEAVFAVPFLPSIDGYHRGAIVARSGIWKKNIKTNARMWIDFLDEVGIETTVLYPSDCLAHGLIQDPEWAVAVARAYNNWFYDRYYSQDSRLKGMAVLPLQDVPEAVKELRRAVTELHMAGGFLVAHGSDLGVRKPLGDPEFWPIYEEAERLNCPLAIHGGPSAGLGINAFRRFAATHTLEHPFALMIQLTSMIFEGVFERFPMLRVGFLEGDTGWVPFLMDRLDRSYEVWKGEYSEDVKRPPSEYIRSGRIFFGCEGEEESMRYVIERLGSGVLLFSSDFPHETTVERARKEIAKLIERPDLTLEAKWNILRNNALRFYQFK